MQHGRLMEVRGWNRMSFVSLSPSFEEEKLCNANIWYMVDLWFRFVKSENGNDVKIVEYSRFHELV